MLLSIRDQVLDGCHRLLLRNVHRVRWNHRRGSQNRIAEVAGNRILDQQLLQLQFIL